MSAEYKDIPLNQIKAKDNYRKTFKDETLKELAVSIKENGVIEPVIVRRNGNGYVLISGERRFRAAEIARLAAIPAIVRDIPDADALKIQIIENAQRENVPFMEEAYAVARLRDECELDVAEISGMIGKSEVWVYQNLRLTKMHGEAQRLALNGFLLKSVAILISSLKHEEDQCQTASALARTQRNKLVEMRFAREWIEKHIEANGRKKVTKRTALQKEAGSDFCANWKKYLVRFSVEQFERWKKIVRGRTDIPTLSEAVDLVMRRAE